MKKPQIGMRTGGFTLVELMVSIVIVVALAGMVFALAKGAMTKSRLAASMTAVRNLGVMVQAYTQDNAGQLPVWKDQSQDLYWWGMLVDDVRNESQLEKFRSPGHKEFSSSPGRINLSYGWNASVVGRYDTSDGDDGPKRLASFKDPSRILVLADGPRVNGDEMIGDGKLPDPERYGGKAAGLLLDGSARQMVIESDFRTGSVWFLSEEEREARGSE